MIEIRPREDPMKFDLYFDGENITEDGYTVLCLEGSFDKQGTPDGVSTSPPEYVGKRFFLRINKPENIERFMPLTRAQLPPTVSEMSFLNAVAWEDGFTLAFDFHFQNDQVTVKQRADVYAWKHPWSLNDYFEAFNTAMAASGGKGTANPNEPGDPITFDGATYWGSAETFADVIRRASEELRPHHEAALQALSTETDASFLRLYVPQDKYQAEQVETFVRLFENYMNRIERCALTVDVLTSQQGKYFVFRMPDKNSLPPDFASAVAHFDAFMTLCKNDPVEASRIVIGTGVSVEQSTILVTSYGKRYTRLLLDSKQEFEAKCLMLRHALESDVMEAQMDGQMLSFPQSPAVGGLLLPALGTGSGRAPATGVEAVSERLSRSNAPRYTADEEEMLRLIRANARDANEAISLTADFDVVKDVTASPAVREGAWIKLKAFGKRNSAQMLQILSNSLVSYLMSKVEGGP